MLHSDAWEYVWSVHSTPTKIRRSMEAAWVETLLDETAAMDPEERTRSMGTVWQYRGRSRKAAALTELNWLNLLNFIMRFLLT
ncbi:hypothetical protein AK812_SmicGene45947, partial [Symbiodinium microadriaticum]